jgi:ATP-dependent helicase/nuclease subunit A
MNLHKAKGLEADVVFLADPCGGFKSRVDVHIHRESAVPQGWFTVLRKRDGSFGSEVLGQHADWPRHEQAELPYLVAEEDRLLYVAATRASEMLVVSRWTEAKGVPAWGAFNAFLTHATELTVPASVTARPVSVPDCSAAVRLAADAMRASVHARATESSWAVTSVSAEARHVAKMVRSSDPTSADDVTKVVRGDTPSHRADAGVAWGTLVHGLLEHAMRHEGVTRDDLRRLALWLTVEQPQLRPVIDDAVETALGVSTADFWARAKAAAHLVEAPFTVADGERRLLTGVIDLVFADRDGWRVVDYKTDVSKELVAAGKYAEQMAAYERALKACGLEATGVSVQPVRIDHGSE